MQCVTTSEPAKRAYDRLIQVFTSGSELKNLRPPGSKLAPPAAGQAAVTRASLQADLLAAHERASRLNAQVRQLEKRLSEALGEQAWRASPVGCQNSATGLDLGFYAAPLVLVDEAAEVTGRRWIRRRSRSATGWSGQGERSWRSAAMEVAVRCSGPAARPGSSADAADRR